MDPSRLAELRTFSQFDRRGDLQNRVRELCDELLAAQAETQEYRTKAALHIKAIAKSHDEARAAMNAAVAERDVVQAENQRLTHVMAGLTAESANQLTKAVKRARHAETELDHYRSGALRLARQVTLLRARVRHGKSCSFVLNRYLPCSCGLDAILDDAAFTTTEETPQ